jgi:cell division protein FtsI/penicillin-binding protein 2
VYTWNHNRRTKAVFLFLYSFLSFCFLRLLYIQFFKSSFLAELANKQYNSFVELEPWRGRIFDRNLKLQAVNIAAYSLYASPNIISNKEKEMIVDRLSPILGLEHSYLKSRIYRNKAFVWLARKLNDSQAGQIKNLNLKGLGFIKESRRSYPNEYLMSHVLGFAGLDNKGLEGLEMVFDNYLKGEDGWAVLLRDARQKKLDLYQEMSLPRDGYDIVLTIDEVIQYIAERELDKAFDKYRAKSATIIVMNPHTGEILALANRPTYDLNIRGNLDKNVVRNQAICDMFEPGSVFKIVTASAALEENKVKESDTFFCENGEYRVANHTLHDHTPHGVLTFKQVIEQSSNIGTVKVAQLLGPDLVYKYEKLFGFGSKLGVDMPGEISGMVKDPRFWSKTSIGAVPIGHEVGVTALQLASAISVIANGGQLMRPYVVKEIIDKQGEKIKEFNPKLINKVISTDTAARVKRILQGAVEEGTGKLAKINGVSCAGKTGTAQKIEPNGTYSHSKYVASFIGFAPVDDPQVAIVVVLDEPRPYYFGGVVSAPVFKNVAAEVLKYLKLHQAYSNVNSDSQ